MLIQKDFGATHQQGGLNLANYTLKAIQQTELGLVWDEVKPHLEKVVEYSHGDITIETMRNELVNGRSWLIAVYRDTDIVAAITVDIRTMDSGKRVLMVPVVGGADMEHWLPMLHEELLHLKKMFVCDSIRGAGRPGWARELKKYGWKPIITVVSLED
jgi:hypothetical protein